MKEKETEKKIKIQKEHYAKVPIDRAYIDKRATSNHYYKIEQIEKVFYDYLLTRGVNKKYTFMEIGVGTGIHAQHFLDTYKNKINNFLACDLSEAMLEVSRIRLKDYLDIVSYYQCPAEEIKLDMKFDGIYISGSMHHFADPEQAIARIKDLLAEQGVLVICEPNVWNPYNFFRALREGKEEIGQFTTARRGRVRSYLNNSGFDIIEEKVLHYRSGWGPLKKIWPYARLNKCNFFDLLSIMFLFVAKHKKN